MAKQVISNEIEDIRTDTIDRLVATLSFTVEGRRNVPSLENLGKAADAASWLFRNLLETSYITDIATRKAQVDVIREQTKSLVAANNPSPVN